MTTETLSERRCADPVQAPPSLVRLPLRRTLAELAFGTVVAVLVSLAVQAVAGRLHIGPGNYVPAALVNLLTAVLIAVLLAAVTFARFPKVRLWGKLAAVWALLAVFATAIPSILLQGTRFFFGGASVDNSFRLQLMERMTASLSLADGNYEGVAPYYPGAWFWLGGRFANLFGLEGWAAYKQYAILWVAVTAVVAYVLWSLVLRRRMAVLVTLVTVLAGFSTAGVEEPYAWPTAAWLPPIAVLVWHALRRRDRTPGWVLALIGVYLGFAGITYTLHVGFGALVVVGMAVVSGILDIRAGTQWRTVLRSALPVVAITGVIALVITLLTWAPFLLEGGLGKPNHAARFLPSDSAYFPLPFGPGSVFGALCLAGLLWLVIRARKDAIAAALLITTALVYAWFGISMLALLGKTTLLAFRFTGLVDLLLMVAGVFGGVELVRYLMTAYRAWTASILTVAAVLSVAGAVTISQTAVGSELKPLVDKAEKDYYPTGTNAANQRDAETEGSWTGGLIGAIDELSGRPAEDNIVLSESNHLLSFKPYWGYQHTTPQYANPLARYDDRSAEVHSLAESTSPQELIGKLDRSEFTGPNVFVLRTGEQNPGKLMFSVKSDFFPQPAPVKTDEVFFDEKLFDSPEFTKREVGPFTVLVRR